MGEEHNILKQHLEILSKKELSLEDIKYLLKHIPSKENLKAEDKKLINEIINLAEKHKKILLEKIKDNIKSLEAKRKYEPTKFNFRSFSRKV